ncbi:unnamed protein product [Arabidopsis lyrata]|nr:unnamed protein product [Arabidopsis lyrata]
MWLLNRDRNNNLEVPWMIFKKGSSDGDIKPPSPPSNPNC